VQEISLHWLLVKGFCQTFIPFWLQYTNTESEQFALAPLHVDIFTRTPCSGFCSSTNKQTNKTHQLNAGLMIYHRFACINLQSLPYSEIMVPFIRRSGEYSIDLDYYTAVWKFLTLNFHKNIRTLIGDTHLRWLYRYVLATISATPATMTGVVQRHQIGFQVTPRQLDPHFRYLLCRELNHASIWLVLHFHKDLQQSQIQSVNTISKKCAVYGSRADRHHTYQRIRSALGISEGGTDWISCQNTDPIYPSDKHVWQKLQNQYSMWKMTFHITKIIELLVIAT
jgi:hypothetical protein